MALHTLKTHLFLMVIGMLFTACADRSKNNKKGTETPADSSEVADKKEHFTEEELLTKVQEDVLAYFWDYAEENSGLARERYDTDNPSRDENKITTGGTGFGFMTLLVAIENDFLPREEVVNRLKKGLDFLDKADRFHGAWPHWLDGETGNVLAFGDNDDGADIVETAFLVEGLICIREYFKDSDDSDENYIAEKADELWKGVDWNWFTQGENVLYWHWSPNTGFEMNHKIEGFDETLITYILAASSPDHSITKKVYDEGWARDGGIKTSLSRYDIPTVVAHNVPEGAVGPMFWSQYSFLGLDPRGLRDEYADYGEATLNHAKIMYNYALDNPNDWKGYGENNWGLTASYSRNEDGSIGYNAHSPGNDKGVIAPTAALSSIVYLPEESIDVMRFIYEDHPDLLIGEMGPYDAYSTHYDNWVAPRYLAIDQGTISPMIENYKTAFLWNLFMNAPEIKKGLKKLGFTSDRYDL